MLGAALVGLIKVQAGHPDEGQALLGWVFSSGQDPAVHPFAVKYLTTRVTTEVAPGVTVVLPVNRDAVGLVLAELHQANNQLVEAIDVVEQLEPTTHAAVSLAELYAQTGRHADVVAMTEGMTNVDDATALLCTFRGAAFRELGHFTAAREVLREALKSKSRQPTIRHRALLERATVNLAEGKRAMARRDLERILAEDSHYEGLQELLAQLINS